MRRVVLLFNPVSGRHPRKRHTIINAVAQAIRSAGHQVTVTATESAGSAGAQAAAACECGADIVFACGGDGTIHEVLQGIAFHPTTALGIVPLGSANVLARHLHLPLNPTRAALIQLQSAPVEIPLGRVTYQTPAGERSRYFIVMAGAGPDGALVYKMLAAGKHRFGRLSYYIHAAQMFCRSSFSAFPVTAGGETRPAVGAMAVRVADLGGLFSPLVRGASIHHTRMLLTIARPPAWLSLSAWFATSWTRTHHWNSLISATQVTTFHCGEGTAAPVQVQADGEWLGQTPMTATLMPSGLRLLIPSTH